MSMNNIGTDDSIMRSNINRGYRAEGSFRTDLLGKRSNHVGRTVSVSQQYIPYDQVIRNKEVLRALN